MVGFPIFASRRLRSTPYTRRVESLGVGGYTVYNHMLVATSFESLALDCAHLKRYVQLWDVSVERQVELCGKDARRLAMLMSGRDLSEACAGRCYYAPVTDSSGGMLNDPVVLCLSEDRFWFSIADSDLLLWAMGLAQGLGLDVRVFEPDVSPLAVQGPRSDDLLAEVFGESIRALRFFRFGVFGWRGRDLVISRSGWSRQGGFEIYLDDSSLGEVLWDDIWERGADYNLRAGCPNLIERIEGGLLSYGNDMTREDTPLECGLEKYVSLDCGHDFIGKQALQFQRARGVDKRLCGVRIAGEALAPITNATSCSWRGEACGIVTSAVWSSDFACNLGFAMLHGSAARASMAESIKITVDTIDGERMAKTCPIPFTKQQ